MPKITGRHLRALMLAGLLVPLIIFMIYRRRSPQITYKLPEAVLPDYISPVTHCFWDDSVASGGGQKENASRKKVAGTADLLENDAAWSDKVTHFDWEGPLPDVVPASSIEQYMQAHIDELQQPYNERHDYKEYGLNLGNVSLSAYRNDLLSIYQQYLQIPNEPTPSFLPPILSRLSLRPPIAKLPPRPRQIMTTDKSIDNLPWEFARWKEIMTDWEIRYFDDRTLEAWINGIFGGTKAEKIWKKLPRVVLKTDVFRYMALLVEGGIYADSDTAPIIHADRWGFPHEDGTPPLLTHLSRLLSLSTSPHLPSSHPLSTFSSEIFDSIASKGSWAYDGPIIDDGAELGEPGLVISVESDAIDFGWDNWREVGLSRAVQIVQWTIMARPGHPVFLDCIGRALRKSEEMAEKTKVAKAAGENFIPETALEWTGPGIFTDCVYRYLLARYGYRPEQLIHQKVPIRIGDVLILPAGSYSSVSPFTGEDQRDWAASFHGFFGRWRDADPGVQDFERKKKEKEEAEAEVADMTEAEVDLVG